MVAYLKYDVQEHCIAGDQTVARALSHGKKKDGWGKQRSSAKTWWLLLSVWRIPHYKD